MKLEKVKEKTKELWIKHKGKVCAFILIGLGAMGEKALEKTQRKSYMEGLDTGEYIGYTNGHSDGYSKGYTEGHTNGYDEGYSDASNYY